MKEGAYDYIVKPFVMQQLLLIVRNAYKMEVLIDENEKLSNHLKETYRNLETVKALGSSRNENVEIDSVGSIEKLKELNIINADEVRILKERIASRDLNGNIKKYSSLVNDLKT